MLADIGSIAGFEAGELAVVATNDTQVHERGASPCYSGIKIDADNNIYSSGLTGTYVGVHDSDYVKNGTTSQVYVERTINTGALTTDGIGASRVVCSTDRTVECIDTDSGAGSVDCNLTVSFYDAASGGNLLDTATYDLSANYTTA